MLTKLLSKLRKNKSQVQSTGTTINFTTDTTLAREMSELTRLRNISPKLLREFTSAMSVVNAALAAGQQVYSLHLRADSTQSICKPISYTIDVYGMSKVAIRRELARMMVQIGECTVYVSRQTRLQQATRSNTVC